MRLVSRFLKEGVTATDRRRIIRGTLHSFLIQGISIGLVFVSNLWLVRSSNAQAYGDYVHVFNWVSILSVLVMGGPAGTDNCCVSSRRPMDSLLSLPW